MSTLYKLPYYYDVAFTRNISAETGFFIDCFMRYSRHEVRRVLEVACGSGMFLRSLAERDFQITGYDLSPEMVEYAQDKNEAEGLQDRATAVVGDMRSAVFPEPFDAALNLISSLSYCVTDGDIRSHFDAMRQSLKPGSVYIVEIFCACESVEQERTPELHWRTTEGELKIEVNWMPHQYDLANKTRKIDLTMNVKNNGNSTMVKEHHSLRLWFFEDFLRLTREAGFSIRAIYDQEFRSVPLDSRITGKLGALYYVLVRE